MIRTIKVILRKSSLFTKYILQQTEYAAPWLCAIASRAYLGNPKIPAIFVYQLVDGQYQPQRFSGTDRVRSRTFPELQLTVEQIVAASLLGKL